MDVQTTFTTEYDFLGVHCVHRRDNRLATTSLMGKTLRKISAAKDEVANWGEGVQPTLRQVLRNFGLLMYASRTSFINIADFYVVFKFIRRKLKYPLDAELSVWFVAINGLRDWLKRALKNTPRAHGVLETTPSVTLYTDASLAGWGGVLLDLSAKVLLHFGSWKERFTSGDINLLEFRAVLHVLSCLAPFRVPVCLHLCVDNSSLATTLTTGRSNDFTRNEMIRVFAQLLRQRNVTSWSVRWISGLTNIADKPSRLGPRFDSMMVLDKEESAHFFQCGKFAFSSISSVSDNHIEHHEPGALITF
jgi:hypothetical protein